MKSKITAVVWMLRTWMIVNCIVQFKKYIFNSYYGPKAVAADYANRDIKTRYQLLDADDMHYIGLLGSWSHNSEEDAILKLVGRPFKRKLARHGLELRFTKAPMRGLHTRGLNIVPGQS